MGLKMQCNGINSPSTDIVASKVFETIYLGFRGHPAAQTTYKLFKNGTDVVGALRRAQLLPVSCSMTAMALWKLRLVRRTRTFRGPSIQTQY